MALGKIKADTLEHSTAGSVDTQFVVVGANKLYCSLNGTGTAAIRDSLNTSSITDHGSGSYSVIASSSMSSANYGKLSHTGDDSGSGGNVTIVGGQRGFAPTSSTVKLACSYHADSSSLADHGDVNLAYVGDLA
tara:strand:+ start:359 stop:760 length:402 start_codon:yes stop_codon:yes gene_type:complete